MPQLLGFKSAVSIFKVYFQEVEVIVKFSKEHPTLKDSRLQSNSVGSSRLLDGWDDWPRPLSRTRTAPKDIGSITE